MKFRDSISTSRSALRLSCTSFRASILLPGRLTYWDALSMSKLSIAACRKLAISALVMGSSVPVLRRKSKKPANFVDALLMSGHRRVGDVLGELRQQITVLVDPAQHRLARCERTIPTHQRHDAGDREVRLEARQVAHH